MPFHVPFNQRASRRQQLGPVYIGFEPVAPPRPKFNWWGFNGMWMSMASLLTLGFTSIVPFFVSLVGLRRPGKKMAAVGTVVSLAGMVLAGSLVAKGAHELSVRKQRRAMAVQARQIKKEVAEAGQLLEAAREDLIEYRGINDGRLPEDLEGNILVVDYIDPWGESLRFELEKDHGLVRSAGPDKEFLTDDDLMTRIDGKSSRAETRLPLRTASTSEE